MGKEESLEGALFSLFCRMANCFFCKNSVSIGIYEAHKTRLSDKWDYMAGYIN